MAELKLQHIRELNRIRQQKYYYAHQKEINLKHREKYHECIDCLKNQDKKEAKEEEVETEDILPSTTIQNVVINLNNNKNIKSASTLKKYIDDLSTIVKLLNTTNLNNALKKSKDIIKKLKTAKSNKGTPYSINSLKGFIQAILFLISNYDLEISEKEIKNYIDYFDELKLSSSISVQKKQEEEEEVIMFDKYLELVKETFGELSKEYLLASVYNEVTCRDDLGHLRIVYTKKETDDEDHNFLILPRGNTLASIVLNAYKTSEKYGTITTQLSKQLTDLIRAYTSKNNIKYDDYLFGASPLLSALVGKINSAVDVRGSINTLRQMKVSEFLTKEHINDVEKRIAVGKILGHSPITSLKYLRTVKT